MTEHTEDYEVYEDYEEYVDHDQHEAAASYQGPGEENRDREHEEEVYDEYIYGTESGEAYEQEGAG